VSDEPDVNFKKRQMNSNMCTHFFKTRNKELLTPDTGGPRGSNSSKALTSRFPDVAVLAAAVASVGLSLKREDPVGAEVWRGLSLTGEEPFGAEAAEIPPSLQLK